MPNTREKLIELLQGCIDENVEPDDPYVGFDVMYEKIADYLIANGVTVQEWISVKDRLPEDDLPALVTCGKGYRPFVARYDFIWKKWRVSHTLKITHWQPLPSTRNLPQPPKGE